MIAHDEIHDSLALYTSFSNAHTRPGQDYAQNKSPEPYLERKLEPKRKAPVIPSQLPDGGTLFVLGTPPPANMFHRILIQYRTVGARYDIRLGATEKEHSGRYMALIQKSRPEIPRRRYYTVRPNCACVGMPNLIPICLQIYLRYSG